MDAVKIGLAVQSGVSPVCATCKRYWEGRAQGLPDPKCTTKRPCGSPFAGYDFPEYDGPMTDLSRWCFVCATTATKALKCRSTGRAIGICDEHIEMVGQVEPIGLNGTPVNIIIASDKGEQTPEQYFGPPKQTLGQAIAEADAYLDEEDRRKAGR